MAMAWELVAPNRWRWRTHVAATKINSSPYVVRDEMEPTEQVDGKFYTSKAKFRAVGRALGLTEVGNEKFAPKQRSTALRETKRQRIETLRKAIAEYRMGRRPEGR